jgi:hypothetical protein
MVGNSDILRRPWGVVCSSSARCATERVPCKPFRARFEAEILTVTRREELELCAANLRLDERMAA